MKTGSMLVCRPCDCTFDPGTYDECKRKDQRCSSASRLSFSDLFDISLVLDVGRLCVVVYSLISVAKVCKGAFIIYLEGGL